MTWEGYWYRSYDAEGNAPRCRRLARCEPQEQWDASIDIAIAIVTGRAGWRPVYRTLPGLRTEYWYYWPNRLNRPDDTGWWLIAERFRKRSITLIQAARQCAMRRGPCTDADIAARLERWRATRRWRRYVGRMYAARRPTCGSYAKWERRVLGAPSRKRPRKARGHRASASGQLDQLTAQD